MTALVRVEWSLARLPARVPHRAVVVDVEIASAIVHRHTVVAIAGDATELCVFVEVVTSGCV